MIPFKDITLADKDTITSFTMKSDRRNCDLSFSNLCSWRFLYDTQFAVVDNFLVFKFWAGEQLAYMMPVGTGDLKAVLWELIEDARKRTSISVCWECAAICALISKPSFRNSSLSQKTATMRIIFI